MPSSRSRNLLFFALATASLWASPPAAGAAPRGQFVFHGRVLDESGAPVPEAWVVVKGSRRMGTVVGADGSYLLSVPGATNPELSRSTLKLRLQARRSGWRFQLDGGALELGIEMEIARDSTGIPRLLVSSNDPVVAATVANAAVLEATPHVDFEVTFVGTRGKQHENDPVELPSTQRVVLVGGSESSEEEGSDSAAVEARAPAEPGRPVAREAGGEPQAPGRPDSAAAGKGSGREPPEPSPPAPKPLAATEPSPSVSPREPARTGASLAAPAAPPAPTPPESPRAAADREPPAGAAQPAPARPSADSSAAQQPPAAEPPPAPPPSPRITLVGSGPIAATPPATSPRPAPAGSCQCLIRGTIEVDAERPLEESTTIVVLVDEEPAVRDTVVLFMGSPRAFALGGVSCIPHRLRLEIPGRHHPNVVSKAPIDCAGGGTRNTRMVLIPAGRGWTLR